MLVRTARTERTLGSCKGCCAQKVSNKGRANDAFALLISVAVIDTLVNYVRNYAASYQFPAE